MTSRWLSSRRIFLVLFALALAYLAWIAWQWGEVSAEMAEALRSHSAIARHLGALHRIEMDMLATGETPAAEDPDDSEFVFTLAGDKGSGSVIATFATRADRSLTLTGGTLSLDSGQRVKLRAE